MPCSRGTAPCRCGRAAAGEHVSVAFAGQVVGTTAGPDGRWIVVLAPLAANSSGAALTVTGKGSIAVNDVVVGEVWLCSGGSESGSVAGDGARNENAAPSTLSHWPPIRRFVVARRASPVPLETATGEWEGVSPSAAGAFTSAGSFFARDLLARLGVPIGIVESTWPDTPIESWMSPAALAAMPESESGRPEVAAPVAEDSRVPSSLFNGMIHPLLPYAIRGALWLQGDGDIGSAARFAVRFPELITAWRSHFGEGDFPFYWVELRGRKPAPGASAGQRAPLREAQHRALSLPSTGEAVAIDLGSGGGFRPADYEEIGRRLALIAKAGAYSISEDYCGPVFGAIEVAGSSVRVRFFRGEDGLTASGKPLQSFEVAGADRVYHAASAVIAGDSVIVHSAAVRQPVAVRYAWSDAPEANLYNGAGLPAAPFRSDDWQEPVPLR